MRMSLALLTIFALASISLPAAWAYDCTYGNSSSTATSFSALDPDLLGSYSYLIHPGAEGCGNGVGFSVSAIRIWLVVDSGGSFEFQASILEAVDSGDGCFVPGEVIETSAPTHVSGWPEIGGIDVGSYSECGCLPADRAYFLSIDFLSIDADVSIIRSPDSTACTSYLDRGAGILDLQGFDGGGGLAIFCNASNCDDPTPTIQPTWGSVKARYR